jgi:hypothetical protein
VWSKPVGTSNAPYDDYTSENVITVSLVEEANAYDALTRLKQLEAKSAIGLRDAAVVLGEDDGKIEQKDQASHTSTTVTTGGSSFDDDTAQTESVLSDMSKSINVGSLGLLADVYERDNAAIDAVMACLNRCKAIRCSCGARARRRRVGSAWGGGKGGQ